MNQNIILIMRYAKLATRNLRLKDKKIETEMLNIKNKLNMSHKEILLQAQKKIKN